MVRGDELLTTKQIYSSLITTFKQKDMFETICKIIIPLQSEEQITQKFGLKLLTFFSYFTKETYVVGTR